MDKADKVKQELIEEIAKKFAYWHIVAKNETGQDTMERWLIRAELIRKDGFAQGIEHYRKVILPVMVGEARKDEKERIEYMFADNDGMTTFIRKRDGKAGVENCKLIIVDEWQALKGEK